MNPARTDADRNQQSFEDRVQAELEDNLDEELELELGDDLLARLPASIADTPQQESFDRRRYFTELLRLQRELIKLQDWVVDQKLKVVVLFEGRDAAGKGGVIKRITQRLNPRVCRDGGAARADRARAHANGTSSAMSRTCRRAGEIVLFDRSWYNRAGVERVMGFCTEDDVEEFFRTVPEFERMLVRSGIVLLKYWFSITDDEQNLRFLMRIHDPLKQWKLSPMDLRVAPALGGVHQGQGGDAGRARTSPRRPGGWSKADDKKPRPSELHPSSAAAGPLSRASRISRSCCRSASTSLTTCARRYRRRCTCRRSIDRRMVAMDVFRRSPGCHRGYSHG